MVAGRALAIGRPSKDTTAAASISDACASRSASARSSWLERLVASGMVGTSLAAALGALRPATSPSAHNGGCLKPPSVPIFADSPPLGGDLLRGKNALFPPERRRPTPG